MNWKNNSINIGFILLLMMGLSSFSNAQVNQMDKQGRRSGEWLKYYEHSVVPRYKGYFVHGRPVGKFVYYFQSNKIKAIILHDSVSDYAKAYYYFRNKKVAAFGIYHGKKKDSVWTEFSPNGDITSRTSYKNGKLDGVKIIYYGSDVTKDAKGTMILSKTTFKNGVADGPFSTYFDDGTTKSKGVYKNGEKEGVVKSYNPNGTLMMINRFKGGVRHGWWISYDDSGKENGRTYYKDGDPLSGKSLKKYMAELKAKGINPND